MSEEAHLLTPGDARANQPSLASETSAITNETSLSTAFAQPRVPAVEPELVLVPLSEERKDGESVAVNEGGSLGSSAEPEKAALLPPHEKDSEKSPATIGECRICQEEDTIANLDAPCVCAGSLKYAHPTCLQHWCNEKRNTTCEICHSPYKPSYTAPPPLSSDQPPSSVLSIEIREGAGPTGAATRMLTLRDTVTGEETTFDLSEAEEPQDPLACCKSFLLIILLLLFLPRALNFVADADPEGGDLADLVKFVFHLVVVFLPLIILLRVVWLLNERRMEQEAANLEATEAAAQVAFLLHARHAQLFARSTPLGEHQRPPGATQTRPLVAHGVV